MRKCVLHIGTEKTGTTSLQEWLYHNRRALSAHGLYLSGLLGQPNNRIFPAFFSRQLDEWSQVKKLRSVAQKDSYLSDFEDAVTQELNAALKSHDQVVISSEHLHSRIVTTEEIEAIKRFLTSIFDQIHVVCYFRSQADMGLSLYSTALKFGHVAKLADFMDKVCEENYYYNFEKIADNWSAVFGPENCIFRIYDRKLLVAGDIRHDFLEISGIQHTLEDFDFRQTKSNESLSQASAATFAAINLLLPSLPDKQTFPRKATRLTNKVLKRIAHKSLSSVGGKPSYMYMDDIHERFKNSNARFFAKYFDGVEHF